MLPIARTAVIVVGTPQSIPESNCIDYRFVDHQHAHDPKTFQAQLLSDWCYQYDNLLVIYPPTVDCHQLIPTEAQWEALDLERQQARLTLPFRLRRLPCPLPAAGFGLTLLRALKHLNTTNLPLDVALQRLKTDIANMKIQQLLLAPEKDQLASCPLWLRWQHRLKTSALICSFQGYGRAERWKSVKAETALQYLFSINGDALEINEACGALWVVGFPGTVSDLTQHSGFQSLTEAIHDQGGAVRYWPELREGQYSLAWTHEATAPVRP